jgi:hypothetical protein
VKAVSDCQWAAVKIDNVLQVVRDRSGALRMPQCMSPLALLDCSARTKSGCCLPDVLNRLRRRRHCLRRAAPLRSPPAARPLLRQLHTSEAAAPLRADGLPRCRQQRAQRAGHSCTQQRLASAARHLQYRQHVQECPRQLQATRWPLRLLADCSPARLSGVTVSEMLVRRCNAGCAPWRMNINRISSAAGQGSMNIRS